MKNGGIMNKRERIKTVFLYGVFICYILLLIKILLLSRISHSEFRSINLIPFHSIMEYISGSSANIKTFAFGNVVGNIVIFIPLGIYFPLFKNDKRVITNLLFIFIVSLFVEIIQGLLGIGVSDIDDIILNCFGGLIGILGYKFLLFILRDEKKVHTVITILSAIGLPCILYYLFMVRMRF
ncbi:MAG: VanZ family protein [Clostridium sp.]|nr:VanZ family protein [Clostridium sp.]